MPNQKQKERNKVMKTYLNSQELFEEQEAKLLKTTERIGVEKFRHKLLEKLVEERNSSAFDAIEFPKLNELIEEVYREFGYE